MGGIAVVRISDLVRGKKEIPDGGGDMHSVRLKNVADMIQSRGLLRADEADPGGPAGHPEESAAAVLPPTEAAPTRLLERMQRKSDLPPALPTAEGPLQTPASPSADERHAGGGLTAISDSPVVPVAKEIFFDAQRYLLDVKEGLQRSGTLVDFEKSVRIVERIVAAPLLIEELYPLTMGYGSHCNLTTCASVNCMCYCLKIGTRMGYAPAKLVTLALAALHHDIGMFLVPEAILQKTTRLTSEELAEIGNHTRVGRDLLRDYEPGHPEISLAVYQHHERESGQGYPEGVNGSDICEYAKIIGICDSYEAMTHVRPHKQPTEQHVSVLELMETKALYFSPQILKVFLNEITLYPVGSHVRLNNQSIGIVVCTNPNNPFKPTVRIVVDGQGNKVTGERLFDLAGSNILNIVSGASADDVPA